ncbi:hypothetical protein [[Flexibacter] sp. ATCC 35103]|uniref:hypothetical protein n=1 Tax=[Flexibacter] sp. ATCC 35103 TaxID=1937528 RepID=UPI0009D4560B|nr:hypothetical protein [[Flexibacter] sp. ATCC 35103]OMQ09750.1 hypothetical protein BXU01_15310 [[Flexibacter] sp. ATCC 35103]
MATFTTTINLNQEDVRILKSEGYSLYGFKSVNASGDGSPTVWFNLPAEKILGSIKITWQDDFQAYISTNTIAPKTRIEAMSTVETDLGQLVSIERGSANLEVSTDGIHGAISFLNKDSQRFSVGISQVVNGRSSILCAFPILGSGSSRVITPVPKIALIFSTEQIEIGTVITKAMSSGAFINLKDNNSRVVNYNVDEGWSADGGPWLKSFNAFTDLKKLLIENASREELALSEKFV